MLNCGVAVGLSLGLDNPESRTAERLHNITFNSPRKEESHGNRKSTQWKAVCGKSARTV